MALSWNPNQRNLLASGSADFSVKLWDLSTLACLRTYTHHRNKVSSIEWNPVESAVLLTGSFDRTAKVFDTRNPEAVATWTFATDVECLKWNPFEPHLFLASTEDGFVYAADTRKAGSTLFTLQAHDLAVSSLSFSHYVPGLMVTASIDKTIKVWDVYEGKPRFVATRELDRSALYTVEFSPDSPGVIAVGGMEKGVTTLEVFETAAGTRFISCPCKLGTNHGLPASVSDLHPVLPLPCPMMKENSELPFGALTITHLSQFA
jgi:periodic tryptophan protein 1